MNKRSKSLKALIERAVKDSLSETVGPLFEDERKNQKKLGDAIKKQGLNAPVEKTSEVEEGEEEGEETGADDVEEVEVEVKEEEPSVLSAQELEEIEVDDFIDLLNQFRSGKSLKDEAVKKELSDYWEGLNVPEKKALFAYAQGIAQMVAGSVPGADAPRPGSYEIRTGALETKAAVEKEKKKPDSPIQKKRAAEMPAGESAPIVVGEVADKRKEKRRLMELRRSK